MNSLGLNTYMQKGNITEVYTTKEQIFYVSTNVVDMIKPHTWSLHVRGYPISKIGGKRVFLHNFLLPHDPNFVVDHIDGNVLNNTLENLRVVEFSDNMLNKKQYKNSKLFRGISVRPSGNYIVRLQYKGKQMHLGTFQSFEDAKKARISAEIEYFGHLRRYG